MLILGHLFVLMLLIGSFAYIAYCLHIAPNAAESEGSIADLVLLGTLARESAIITLGIVWVGSLFIDCAEKDAAR